MPRLEDSRPPVPIVFEGETIEARAGDSVAAALIAAGVHTTRESISGAPRGPYCMMGACFECMVEIDGRANRQACMVEVSSGMRVRRQRRAEDAGDG
jgi:predicted molibdopterin-dependent oxidoreductase YjgC